jgi:hypothetical protein
MREAKGDLELEDLSQVPYLRLTPQLIKCYTRPPTFRVTATVATSPLPAYYDRTFPLLMGLCQVVPNPSPFLMGGSILSLPTLLLTGPQSSPFPCVVPKPAQCKNLVRYKKKFAYTHTQQNKKLRVIVFYFLLMTRVLINFCYI